jgi:hypothetical protein
VSVAASQSSIKRGQSAYYVVSVWAKDGSVSGVTLKLSASPTSQRATYSLGCGSEDGTATCDLGTVYSTSSARELQAQIPVASSATSVASVTLTATGAGTDVNTDPKAASGVSITAASSGASSHASPSASSSPDDTSTLPDDDSSFPALNGSGSSYTSGGSYTNSGGTASGLFPTINPSSQPSPSSSSGRTAAQQAAEPAADTTTLPLGTPVVAAQAAGLIVLALAFILAVTRLSVRRRPAPKDPTSES